GAPRRARWTTGRRRRDRARANRTPSAAPFSHRRPAGTGVPGSVDSAAANRRRPRWSERQLETRRQSKTARDGREALLDRALALHASVVDRRGDQVFEHLLVVGEQRRLDRHAPHLVLARHDHLDHAAARVSLELVRRELVLGLLHIRLRLLRLAHQLTQSFHRVPRRFIVPSPILPAGCYRLRAWRRAAPGGP